jgi:hypothetical protein
MGAMTSTPLFRLLVIFAIAALGAGCVQKAKPMYNWCNYSDSLYSCKKNDGTETLTQHQAVLERIITESKEKSMRVPPGVCAELGYVYAAQNRSQEAIGLYEQEKQTYPESALLMNRLISQTEKRTTVPPGSETVSDEKALNQEKNLGGAKP